MKQIIQNYKTGELQLVKVSHRHLKRFCAGAECGFSGQCRHREAHAGGGEEILGGEGLS